MTTFSAKNMVKSEIQQSPSVTITNPTTSAAEQVFIKSSVMDDHDYVTAPHAQVEIHVTTDEPEEDEDCDYDDDEEDEEEETILVPHQSPKKLQLPKDFKENSGFDMLLAAAAFAHCQSKWIVTYSWLILNS